MSNKTKKIIYLIYGILLSILLIISGILLMVSCYNIYSLGDRPFTPDSISAAFAKIQAILYVTVGAVAVGGLMKIFMPLDEPEFKANIAPITTLKRLEDKYDLSLCEKEDVATYKKAKIIRLVLKIITIVICTVFSLPILIVALAPTSYTLEYNQSVLTLCSLIIPCFVVCALIALAYVYSNDILINTQISSIKALIADGKAQKSEQTECTACKRRKERYHITAARIIVVSVALIFIVLGIFNGGMADVLSKAINICTECIGLG